MVQAGIVTLALNEGAYMAEIMRAAIDSVDKGQAEAAESLGMRRRQAMRHVVLPQAMRVVIRRWATSSTTCSRSPHCSA